jgi:hypothetical protein
MATFVQDVWLGGEARLRGRRYRPFEAPPARVLFHPDLDVTLDDPVLVGFLETLGDSLEAFAYEPRGQGGSPGRLGPELARDFEGLIEDADRRWGDRLPIVLAGHGLGASLALSLSGHPRVTAVAALAPLLPPLPPAELWATRPALAGPPDGVDALLASLDLPRRVAASATPLLAVATREDPWGRGDALRDLVLVEGRPAVAFVSAPGDRLAPLRVPWVQVLADWVVWAVGGAVRRASPEA